MAKAQRQKMKLAPQELEQIEGFVQEYKTLPEKRRAELKAGALNLAKFPGTEPHVRAVNTVLHRRLCVADYELIGKSAEKPAFAPPTMQETIAAARATIAWIAPVVVPVAVFGGLLYIVFQALMGLGAAVCAFFTSWGGVLVGLVFVAACLSALCGGSNGEAVEVETKEEKRGQVIINVNVDGEQNVRVG
jgi:hypothetical protein